MQPREIDALIAEKIMEWSRYEEAFTEKWPIYNGWYNPANQQFQEPKFGTLPQFSTDPSASKQLRDRLRELGFDYSLGLTTDLLTNLKHYGCLLDDKEGLWKATANTEEMAVALASLKAFGVEVTK